MSKATRDPSGKNAASRPSRRDLNHARHLLKHGKKWLWVQHDILTPQQMETCEAALNRLRSAMDGESKQKLAATMDDVEKQFKSARPPVALAGWRENFEAIFVALVIAGAVRTYFVQPFKIPTG